MKLTSIQTRLVFSITLLVALLAVTMAIMGDSYFHAEFKEAVATQHFATISLAADQLDKHLARDQEILTLVGAKIRPVDLGDPSRVARILANEENLNRSFDGGVILFDARGRSIGGWPLPTSHSGEKSPLRDLVTSTIESGQAIVSPPYRDGFAPHHPLFTLTTPLKDQQGRLYGVLAGQHDLLRNNILSQLITVPVGKSGYIYILHRDRTLIMHPDKSRLLEHIPPGMNKGVDQAVDGFQGTLENINSRGVRGITSFKNLQQAPWIMASHYPTAEAYAPITRARGFFGITLFIFITTTVVLVWFLARGMAQPLMALADHARRLPSLTGDARQTQVTTNDEIGELAAAFNQMVSELDRQRQFTDSLLENTSTPLFVINDRHEIIFWNRALEHLTGHSAASMVNTQRQWEAFYPASRPTLADLVMDRKESQSQALYQRSHPHEELPGIMRAEGWYPDLNGRDRYLFFDAAPVHDADGQIVAVVETLHDITERKLAEESLRLFSLALEQSASAIILTDTQGTIQYVNRKFTDLTGYSREEVVGQNPRILKSGRQSQEVYADLWQTITSGRQWHGEFHNRRKDGSLYWELVTISPVNADNGDITHFLAVKEDISARKETEYTLRKQQAELILRNRQQEMLFHQVETAKKEWEDTMDCIDDILILADVDNRVRRCNRALNTFTGQEFNTLLGSDWRALFAMDGTLSRREDCGEILHEPSGRWFTIKVYPQADGTGSVIALHDLTEIRRVSRELETAYGELKETHMQLLHQEKMASIGQLAAGVAHEINNPMGFIASNLGTLGKYTDRLRSFIAQQDAIIGPEQNEALVESRRKLKIDYLLEDIPKLLAESVNGAERVSTIVRNLKSFSRVDESELKDADLNECLESTVTIAWNELKYKCDVDKQYGPIPLVRCHPQQLNQVFLNLVVNGAQAIDGQGTITLRSWQEGDDVCVSVRDTGCGIPDEIQRRIFEPFFTTKEVGKGTGLGLSISYDIVKGHGGTIDLQSAAGEGTTFTVRLPLAGPPVTGREKGNP